MTDSMTDAATKETIAKTRGSAIKFYETFWELQRGQEKTGDDNDVDNDDDSDDEVKTEPTENVAENEAIKTISGSSSLDADGGSCGPGDDAFCLSNLLWLGAASFVIYQMEFFDVALLSPLRGENHLNAPFYVFGLILLMINFCIFYYLVVHLSWNRGVKSEEWDTYIPHAVPAATASFVGAALSLSVGLWPRWGVLTVPILSTVFMGFIVVVSMGSQIYKWRRLVVGAETRKKTD